MSLEWEKNVGIGIVDLGIDIGPKFEYVTGDKPTVAGEAKGELRYRRTEKGPFISVGISAGFKGGEGPQIYWGPSLSAGVLF